jgi:hypothetical protein
MKFCSAPMSSMAESVPAKILMQSPRPWVTPSAATCRWLYPRACSLDQQRDGAEEVPGPCHGLQPHSCGHEHQPSVRGEGLQPLRCCPNPIAPRTLKNPFTEKKLSKMEAQREGWRRRTPCSAAWWRGGGGHRRRPMLDSGRQSGGA